MNKYEVIDLKWQKLRDADGKVVPAPNHIMKAHEGVTV
jgi:hypothetical protein